MKASAVAIRMAHPDELPAVASLYRKTGYNGTAAATDRIVVATSDDEIVGAVRLCEECDATVLRGMYLLKEFQRAGIGTQVLDFVEKFLVNGTCYCIPYRHLEQFYSHIGFKRIDESGAPRWLRERCDRYRSEGMDVIIMGRIASVELPSS